jgi:type II secretory pathway pseudopilin PulG
LRSARLGKSRKLAQRCRSAFTLVEILATLAFLGLVIPVAVKAVLLASRAGEIAERSMIAEQLGENKLGELMLANAWTTAESRGTFDDQPGYRWELKRNDWQTGAMTELDMDVFYPVQGGEQTLRLSTLVNEQLVPPVPGQ